MRTSRQLAIGNMKVEKQVTSGQLDFTFTRRAAFVGGVQAAIGLTVAARMSYIAVADNEKYKLLAESNRVNLTIIPPRRGWFVDRYGKPIATNRADFRVDIIPTGSPIRNRPSRRWRSCWPCPPTMSTAFIAS